MDENQPPSLSKSETPAESVDQAQSKSLFPYSLRYRSASTIQEPHLTLSSVGGTTIFHLVYSSDEYCADHSCSALNIAYRSSLDGYATRTDVTTNLTGSATAPQVVAKNDGTVIVVYRSSEAESTSTNIALRTKAAGASQFGARTDITTGVIAATAPQARLLADGSVTIGYASKEWCLANGCTRSNVVLRNSSDAYAARQDVGTDLQCAASDVQIEVQPGTSIVHAGWQLSTAGTCTSTYRSDNFRWGSSADAFATLTRIGASNLPVFAVKSTGARVLFEYSHGSWHTARSASCAVSPNVFWQYYVSTSTNSYSNVGATPIADACGPWGYPGMSVRPSVQVAADDTIYLAYISQETMSIASGNVLSVRSSSDGYASARRIHLGGNFGSLSYAAFALQSNGDPVVAAVSNNQAIAGLNVWTATGATVTRARASKSNAGIATAAVGPDGSVWAAGATPELCEQQGSCAGLNIKAANLDTGSSVQLTTFSQGEVIGGVAIVPPASGSANPDIIYGSNESNATFLNISLRAASTSYATRVALSADTTNHSDLLFAARGPDGLIHLLSGYAGSLVGYANSLDWSVRRQVNQGQAWGGRLLFSPIHAGEVAALYGGNEGDASIGSAWNPKVRISPDLFVTNTSNKAFGGAWAWGRRAAAYDPVTGYLIAAMGTTEANGQTNFAFRNSGDSWAQRLDHFTVANSDIANCGADPLMAIDAQGTIHFMYQSTEAVAGVCNIAYRTSRDWSVRRDLTQSSIAASPTHLFLNERSHPAYCYTTAYDFKCELLSQ